MSDIYVYIYIWHIIWTKGCFFSTEPLKKNLIELIEIWIKIQQLALKKINFKMLPVKWQPFCTGPNVLTTKSHINENHVDQYLEKIRGNYYI